MLITVMQIYKYNYHLCNKYQRIYLLFFCLKILSNNIAVDSRLFSSRTCLPERTNCRCPMGLKSSRNIFKKRSLRYLHCGRYDTNVVFRYVGQLLYCYLWICRVFIIFLLHPVWVTAPMADI